MAANLNSTTITKNNHSKIVIKLKQVELKEKKKNMLYLGCKMKFR